MKRIALVALSVLALAGVASAEVSGDRPDPRAASVRVHDLDLSRAGDAAILNARIERAARRACAVPEVRLHGTALRRAIAACEADAIDSARATLAAQNLSRVDMAAR